MIKQLLDRRFLYRLLKESVSEFFKDNVMRLAAALSYYSVFSIAPLLMIAVGLVSWWYKNDAQNGMIEQQLQTLIGWKAAEAVQSLVATASQSSKQNTFIGFIILFVGAASVFGQLKDSLDTIWEVQVKSGLGIWNMIRQRLLTFSMVLVIGFLLLVSLVGATVLSALGGWIEHQFGLPTALNAVLIFSCALLVETVLFALMFKVLPSVVIEWPCVIVGAVFTALLFEAGKFGLSQYLAHGSATSAFGAAGSVVLVLLWVYYASIILFFGANITEVYARHTGRSIQPAADAQSTDLVCAGGSAVSASTSPQAVSAEPHPLHPQAVPPKAPARESLVPLLREAHLSVRPVPGPRLAPRTAFERARAGLTRLEGHPLAEVAAAVGVGLALGFLSRAFDRKEKQVSASEHLKAGLAAAADETSSRARSLLTAALKKLLHTI